MPIFLLVLIFLNKCDFSRRLQGYKIDTRQLRLTHFINDTYRAGIGRKITTSLRKELHRRANFQLLGSHIAQYRYNHLWLRGRVVSYQKRPRLYTRLGDEKHFRLSLRCHVRLQKISMNKLNKLNKLKEVKEFSEDNVTKDISILLSQEFSGSVLYSEEEGRIETEEEALIRLLRILSIRISKAIESSYLKNFTSK